MTQEKGGQKKIPASLEETGIQNIIQNQLF